MPTGFGSAVNAGEVRPGDTTIVYGIGGVGANALQGASVAGARYVIAVDPVEFKRTHGAHASAPPTRSPPPRKRMRSPRN